MGKIEDVVSRAKKDGVGIVELHFSDMEGTVKSVTIPAGSLEESLTRGTWFDGSSIEGFMRIAESDMYLRPDPDTYAVLPWKMDVKIARFICDVFTPENEPFAGDPRHILRVQVERAKKAGYEYFVGPELEFFLFDLNSGEGEPKTHDAAGYFDFAPRDKAIKVRSDIIFALRSFGIETEMAHHEVAPGQHEIDFHYDEALNTADNAMTFKYVVKTVANQHGLHATFMPKPLFGQNGSGMHVHQSLWKDGKNAFYQEGDAYHLSETAKQFVAGQLTHSRALSAVVAPTVNSYKRLVPGYEAPVYICWAQRNRSALIRIPRVFKDSTSATRCELRFPDPSSNPYLAFAAMLAAGLDGIEKKMEPPKPTEEDVYHFDPETRQEKGIGMLPGSLHEALEALRNDEAIMEALGPHLREVYLDAKEREWDDYRIQISLWEKEKYFETV